MKQVITIIIFLNLVLFIACTNGKKIASYPVVNIALPVNDKAVILLRCTGQGETENSAVFDAEKLAFNTLLFIGYPSSSQVRPLIESETEVKKARESFILKFFESGEYKKYIINSFNYSVTKKTGRYYYLNRDIKINLGSLRSHLEIKGITRKFGY